MAMHATAVDAFNAVWLDVLKTESLTSQTPIETYVATLVDTAVPDPRASIIGFEYNGIRVLKICSLIGNTYAWLQGNKLVVKYGLKINDFFKEFRLNYLDTDTCTTTHACVAEYYIGDGVLGRHLGQRIDKIARLLSK